MKPIAKWNAAVFKRLLAHVCAAGAKEQVAGGVVPGECVGAANVAGVMDGKVGGERIFGLLTPNEEAEVGAIHLVQGTGDDVEACGSWSK